MGNTIDVKFFIQDEATISRALVDFNNIDYVSSATITNFSGSSAGTYPSLILKEPIEPFNGFKISELIVQNDEYEKIKNIYLAMAREKISIIKE